MKIHLASAEKSYTGLELTSHFARQQMNITLDSLVAFLGPCNVPTQNMVDLEDVKRDRFICAKKMIHFIFEHFTATLAETILWQRMFLQLVTEELMQEKPTLQITRQGNDLFVEDRKLNVAIATRSPMSSLFHVGININPEGAPVPAIGLEELKINATAFANSLLNRFKYEFELVNESLCKVRGVA